MEDCALRKCNPRLGDLFDRIPVEFAYTNKLFRYAVFYAFVQK